MIYNPSRSQSDSSIRVKNQGASKAEIPTFVGTLPEHLLEDVEPGRVVVHDEDAQPVGEPGGVGQGHGAAYD